MLNMHRFIFKINMSNQYIVTAHKPTSVSAAITGNITGVDHLNLVVAKHSRLELFLVTAEGLKPIQEIPLFGRIATIQKFRPPEECKDLLFILTCKYQACILDFNVEKGEFVTVAHGQLDDKTGRPAETGIILAIDPTQQAICLRLYDGMLKIVEWQREQRELKAFNVRMDDINVVDLLFLHGCAKPTIAYICQDHNGRHFKTAELSLPDKELRPGPWKQENLESEACMLLAIPEPIGGAVIIGQESISYYKGESNNLAIAPPNLRQSTITCAAIIDRDGSRFILADLAGRVFMLLLDIEHPMEGSVKLNSLKVELLGEVSIPECVVYLDNGVVFVGSHMGDSQLIRLCAEPIDEQQPNNFIQILDTYTNLAPIVDMAVVDLEKQGQTQLITCSGAFKEGSLRIIRNGIGINEQANIDLPDIKGLHALSYGNRIPTEHNHNILIVSFVGQTRALLLEGEDVEETNIAGLSSEEQTLWVGNVTETRNIMQVTPKCVQLLNVVDGTCISSWTPANDQKIGVCSVNATTGQVVVAIGEHMVYLEINNGQIAVKAETELEFEVACLDITPIDGTTKSTVVGVGLWTDMSVRLLSLPKLDQLIKELIGGEMMARSLILAKFESIIYLLVGLGDGTLYYYQLTEKEGLTDRKKVILGTQPTHLRPFYSSGSCNIMACSDRPTVIYSSNNKLVFSNVNLKMVTQMCPLDAAAFPSSLAMADQNTLMIGTVDEIQKLHIRTVPLGETPRRIAHQEETHTLGVISFRYQLDGADTNSMRRSASMIAPVTSKSCAASARNAAQTDAASSSSNFGDLLEETPLQEEREYHSLLIIDQHTFEVIHAHQFGPNEHACSLISGQLGTDPSHYYVVGTALVYPDESEAKAGRLIVFRYMQDNKLHLVHEKEVKGAPYSLALLQGKLLAGINSSVRLFEWTPERELRLECSNFAFTVALYLKTKGDFILAGDLMRSMSVLAYRALESSFEDIAKDFKPNWMTAVEIIDDDTFLGAENSFNLFTCQKDSAATTDEERSKLQATGAYHLGEMVNVFRKGSLVMTNQSSDIANITSNYILYGSVEGGIGVICQLPEQNFKFLKELETKIAKVCTSFGRIEHASWRSFEADRRKEPCHGFVDGDLVETILDMNREQLQQIVEGLENIGEGNKENAGNVEYVLKVVEDMSRIH